MRLGLLAGIGAGLSQGAQLLNQGLAEDRAVRRAEELERMREASFERRWKQQIQREDQLRGEDKAQRASERAEDKALRQQERKEEMGWRQSESNRQAGQFDRQMSQREKQVIEQNLTGVMEQEARAAERIQQRYQKLMADGMGDTSALQAQMAAELEANQMFYSERLHNMIQSYGPQGLSGTGFEYLLNAPSQLPGEDANTNSDGSAEKEAAGNGRLDKLKGITSSWRSQGKTTMPLVEAADNRANALQQSNQRTMQALQRMGSGVNPSLAQQAQERINANNAELERIGLLRDEFMKAVPTTTPIPPNNDWRQDLEYLKRRNHFQ